MKMMATKKTSGKSGIQQQQKDDGLDLQKLKTKLNSVITKTQKISSQRMIQEDGFEEISDKITQHRERLQQIIEMIQNALGYNAKAEIAIKELKELSKQLRLYEEQYKNSIQNSSYWYRLIKNIKSFFGKIKMKLRQIFSSVLSFLGLDQDEPKEQYIDHEQKQLQRINQLKKAIAEKNEKIERERSCRYSVIKHIKKFENRELPGIIKYFQELQAKFASSRN